MKAPKQASQDPEAPNLCPNCDSDKVIPIVYGFPTEETFERERNGELITGGCTIYDGLSPKWHCKRCGQEWGVFGQEDED